VDNRQIVNTGTMSHSYSDETQSIWNGLVGSLRLDARPADRVASIQVFPASDTASVKASIRLTNRSGPNATIKLVSRLLQNEQVLAQAEQLIIPTTSETETSVVLTPASPLQRWDEFNPALYQVEVAIRSNGQDDVKRVSFGARSFTGRDAIF
jgi:beta-galactosidase/beta-glucuronidase